MNYSKWIAFLACTISLPFEGCKIMLSHGLIQVSGDKAKDNLQQAIYNVNKEKKHNASKNEGNPESVS